MQPRRRAVTACRSFVERVDNLPALAPLTTPETRELFYECHGGWCVMVGNGANGSYGRSHIAVLTKRLGVRTIRVALWPAKSNAKAPNYSLVAFEIWGPSDTPNATSHVRSVAVGEELGEWRFVASGTPQSFEDEHRYLAGRRRDRFTNVMLRDYCVAVGIRPFEPAFYGRRGVLLECMNPPLHTKNEEFEEARRHLGIL